MECKFCGTVNADDAVYCKNCGKRLDGKKTCPSCGSVIDDDSVYCNSCGARVDGKIVCKKCGAAYEGAYCPQCGNKTQTVGVKAERSANSEPAKAAIKPSKIINFISLGLVIAVAVLSIIFVCFIGVKLKMSSQSTESGNMNESLGIFDYFSKEIQEVNDLLSGSKVTEAYKTSLYLPAVLGLISVIVSLVGTIAFAITGAVKSILNLVRNRDKNATVWALLAFVFYLFGASMVMSINAGSGSVPMAGVDIDVTFNAATIAGIVLCTVMVAGAVGCDATVYFLNEKLSAYKIVERVLAFVVVVGAVIAIALIVSPVTKLSLNIVVVSDTDRYGNVYEETTSATVSMGLLSLFSFFITLNKYENNLPQKKLNDVNLIKNYVILGQVFIFIAAIAAFLLFVVVLGKNGKKSRVLSIVSSGIFLCAALIALIVTVLAGNKIISLTFPIYLDYYSSVYGKITYAPVIVALVFAVIAFAANICRVVFGAKDKGESGYTEETE